MTDEGDEGEEQALRAAVTALYAVAPADFVAARKEWVTRLRAEGDREAARQVAGLRRPSTSAAAINALVRARDPVVARLRDVGTRLRHAQSALDAAGLAGLRGERDAVLAGWAAAARAHAASPLTHAVEGEIRDTAVAALADADATEVVLSGALTRSLAYSGFGEVDVADAVARTSTGVVLTRIQGGGGAEPADEGGASGSDADPEARTADDDVAPDYDDHDEAGPDLPALRAELDAAEEAVAAARDARRSAADRLTSAQEKCRVAASGVDQARRLLAQAEKHAAAAESAESHARADAEQAEDALAEARARRDDARTTLEEAEDS